MIRIFDILITLILMLVLFPIIILISMLIFFFDGRPIIFKHPRVGYKGKLFTMFKFRTMREVICKDENSRLTSLGKILRKTSLDELPQLFNILKNDMSLVGPRPLPKKIEKKINKISKIKRRKILPGITGMSQINYNGKYRELSEKIKLDIEFIDNYSLYNYFQILLKTPIVMLIRFLKNKSSIIK